MQSPSELEYYDLLVSNIVPSDEFDELPSADTTPTDYDAKLTQLTSGVDPILTSAAQTSPPVLFDNKNPLSDVVVMTNPPKKPPSNLKLPKPEQLCTDTVMDSPQFERLLQVSFV